MKLIFTRPSVGSNFTINITGNINQNIQLDIYDFNGNKRFSPNTLMKNLRF